MALKTEQALPGSIEEAALDAMLSGSSIVVMGLGLGSLIACLRNRAQSVKAQMDAVRNVQTAEESKKRKRGQTAQEAMDEKKRAALGMRVHSNPKPKPNMVVPVGPKSRTG